MTSYAIQIRRRSDSDEKGELVDAELVDGIKPEDLIEIESEWALPRKAIRQQLLDAGIRKNDPNWPGSLHWDWSSQVKAGKLQYAGIDGWAIRCEGRWQGAMLYDDATKFARVEADLGKPLVYIDYIESAPWNWEVKAIGQRGEFESVGARLFAAAVRHSYEQEYHGRVGLHSLRQAEEIYQGWGLDPFGADPSYGYLVYFELTRQSATKWGETK